MTLVLRITVAIMCVLFAAYAVRLIVSGRLLLSYALLWFVLVVIALVSAIFPGPMFAISSALGFQTASNFVLFVGLLLTLAITLSLTVAVSGLSRYVTRLVQENALLRNKVDSLCGASEQSRGKFEGDPDD